MPSAKTEGAGFLSKSEKSSHKDCTQMERPHMGQIKIFISQVGYPKKWPSFCRVKIPIQSVVMQLDISKDYQHLLNESLRSVASTLLLWINDRTLIRE